ncbi:MAG TPA: ABC transporter substrate-binding protein [Jatrophihabitans sp.]|nr:ABC transporter substrate-binding protein [Jatrophihabitans sp.]
MRANPRRAATHRAALASLAAVCTATLLAACSGGGGGTKASGDGVKGQRFKLIVASTATANKVVEAHMIEILKKDGVNASIQFSDASSNVQVAELRRGDFDAYAEAVAGGIAAVAQGIPLVDFDLLQPRQDYVFIARPGIKSLSDLAGKKIGVIDTVGVNWAQALIVLKQAGLSVGQVHMVTAGGQSERLAAMVAGRIDATMLSHSAQVQLQPKGYTVLYDYTRQSPNLYDDNMFAMKSWLTGHKKLAVEVNKATLEAFEWFNDPKNKNDVLSETLALVQGSDKAQTGQLLDTLRSGGAFPDGTILDTSLINQAQTLFLQAKAIDKAVPTAQWVDTSFGQQAKAQLAQSGSGSN